MSAEPRPAQTWVDVTFDCFNPEQSTHRLEVRSDIEDLVADHLQKAGCTEEEGQRDGATVDLVFDPTADDDNPPTGTY